MASCAVGECVCLRGAETGSEWAVVCRQAVAPSDGGVLQVLREAALNHEAGLGEAASVGAGDESSA